MKILLTLAVLLSFTSVYAEEDLAAPVTEKTKCSEGRTPSSKVKGDQGSDSESKKGSVEG